MVLADELVASQTILCIRFHPLETDIIAASSIDENLSIINIDIKNIQKYATGKPDAPTLDTSKIEHIKLKGWGNAIAWAPNGKGLTVAVHNSTIIRVDLDAKFASTKKYLSAPRHLPLTFIIYSGEDTLIGCGYDNLPLIMKLDDNKW